MKTQASYLKTIERLRLKHSENAANGNHQANDAIRAKIILAWEGFNNAKPQTKHRVAPVGYITKPNAAKLMGCTSRSIDNWMKAGIIDYYKFRRAVYFKESDLLEAVEARKVARDAEESAGLGKSELEK